MIIFAYWGPLGTWLTYLLFIHDNICVLGSTEYIVNADDCLLLAVLRVTHQGSTGLHPGIPTSSKNKNMKCQILTQNSSFFSFFLNFFYQSTLKWQNYFSICYLCFEFKKKNKEIILASYAPFQLHMFERSWKKVYENCLNWCRVLGSDELVSHVNYILEELKSPAKHV